MCLQLNIVFLKVCCVWPFPEHDASNNQSSIRSYISLLFGILLLSYYCMHSMIGLISLNHTRVKWNQERPSVHPYFTLKKNVSFQPVVHLPSSMSVCPPPQVCVCVCVCDVCLCVYIYMCVCVCVCVCVRSLCSCVQTGTELHKHGGLHKHHSLRKWCWRLQWVSSYVDSLHCILVRMFYVGMVVGGPKLTRSHCCNKREQLKVNCTFIMAGHNS